MYPLEKGLNVPDFHNLVPREEDPGDEVATFVDCATGMFGKCPSPFDTNFGKYMTVGGKFSAGLP